MRFIFYIASCALMMNSFAQDSLPGLAGYSFPDFRIMDTSLRSTYPFVKYEVNNYRFHSQESKNFKIFYEKLTTIIESKTGKLNIYHIGGSHIQADIYTHDVRANLQSRWDDIPGERGWVFPFDLAQTNNPGNYEFSSPNKWRGLRSVNHKPAKYGVDYGVLGAIITCPDSVITIKYKHDRTTVKPPFNHVRVYHNIGEFPYWLHFGGDELLVIDTHHNPEIGFTDIYLSDAIDTFNIQFQRRGARAPELEIYGFVLMNDDPGISFTSIGINGAGLYTYLGNKRFEEQLKTYPPDFFAFAVGTNDGNTTYAKFKPEVYKRNLEKVMQMVLRANPDCALLLTVPNDSYYHRRYLNKNIARERTVIIELAEEYNMAVWDMYGIMGELGSSKTWRNNKLMRSDMIHFTHPGYHFKGDLYFDAFLKFMDQMESETNLAN
ncbi:MAG: lysophospholipase L1-like esterase [Flavobacteriaceae bacterium]|jgi:lysophospholipase L1-like esterase